MFPTVPPPTLTCTDKMWKNTGHVVLGGDPGGAGPFCAETPCSRFVIACKDMNVRLIGRSKSPGVNVIVNCCVSLYVSPLMNCRNARGGGGGLCTASLAHCQLGSAPQRLQPCKG